MHKPGDVVLAWVQFADSAGEKKRPALVLFEELDNIVVAGITSNRSMKGIPVGPADGLMKESVIKPNYIFTITAGAVDKTLCHLPPDKCRAAHRAFVERLAALEKA